MFESTDGGEPSSLFLKFYDILLISILNIRQAFYEPGTVLNVGSHRTLNARTRVILIFCIQGYTANLVFCYMSKNKIQTEKELDLTLHFLWKATGMKGAPPRLQAASFLNDYKPISAIRLLEQRHTLQPHRDRRDKNKANKEIKIVLNK